jgi:uncharacterized membrane protein YccF (DUF307 family)
MAGAEGTTQPNPQEGRMRMVLAVLMALHAVAHLPGFLVPWRLASLPEMPYGTTVLDGRLDLGDAGIRVVGAAWLAAALAFVVAAVAAGTDRSWWMAAATAAAGVSLVLSVLGLPAARIGIAANVMILAALYAAPRLGWA